MPPCIRDRQACVSLSAAVAWLTRYGRSMRLAILWFALSGCVGSCGGSTWIAGAIDLAPGVTPDGFATLELRGYATSDPAVPAVLDPAYFDSIALAGVAFPYDYVLEEKHAYGFTVFVRAWLSRDPGTPEPQPGEPVGKAVAEVCYCASDAPAYANDVDITLE